jgi:hypothetical protein
MLAGYNMGIRRLRQKPTQYIRVEYDDDVFLCRHSESIYMEIKFSVIEI